MSVNRKSIPDKKAGQPVVRQVRVKPLITSKTFDPAPSEKKELQSIHALLDKMASDATPKADAAGKMAARRWMGKSASQIYSEFCEETSFTALTKIHKADFRLKRVIWAVTCVFMTVMLAVQITWLFQKYFRWPVELSIEVNAVPVLQFPSVTICNINPLKKDNMRSGPFQEKSAVFTLGKDDMIYDDYLNDLMNEMTENSRDGNVSDNEISSLMQKNDFNKWNVLRNNTEMAEDFYRSMDDGHVAILAYSDVAANMNGEELRTYGHQSEDMIISCTWQGMACSPDNFTYVRNNMYGNCYTFNAFDNGQDPLTTNYPGPLMGLTLELNIEQGQYVPALAQDAGVKIVIHERGTYPIPEDAGLSLPPGMKTSIGLDKTEYKRLPPPHADCGTSGQGVVDMYARDFGTAYTKETCLKSCIQAALLDQCACATSIFYVPPGEKVCSMSGNDSTCVSTVTEAVVESCNGRCPTPCDDTVYSLITSMSQWPSENYEDYLDCKISKTSSYFMDKEQRQDSDTTLLKVDVFYTRLMLKKVEQKKAYESENLISDIGGQLGLWLGLSAITFGELIDLCVSMGRAALDKCCDRKLHEEEKQGSESDIA
ncbi:amiloride-sensitive sodium channel subunit beta-2-like [Dreissena polymorpha]|nr:amiloride-sensitive sodium channel subunit beta-2-like [Dreissena polymorpha]